MARSWRSWSSRGRPWPRAPGSSSSRARHEERPVKSVRPTESPRCRRRGRTARHERFGRSARCRGARPRSGSTTGDYPPALHADAVPTRRPHPTAVREDNADDQPTASRLRARARGHRRRVAADGRGGHAPTRVLHGPAHVPARVRADLLQRMDLRRPRRGRAAGRRLPDHDDRRGAARRRPRWQRGDPGPPQRLPPPSLHARRGQRLDEDVPVPVSRLDVRARRNAARDAGVQGDAELRQGRLPAHVGQGRAVGRLDLRQPRRRRLAARRPIERDDEVGRRSLPDGADDDGRAVGVPGRVQLEGIRRQLHRVLPRALGAPRDVRAADPAQALGRFPGAHRTSRGRCRSARPRG